MRKKNFQTLKNFSSLVSLTQHFTKLIFLEQLTAMPQFNMQNIFFFFFLNSHHDTICLVGCFGFKGALGQYFSLYQAVSQREGERGEKGQMRIKMSKQPHPHLCKHNRPLPYCQPNCRTPRHWKFTQYHRTTRPPHIMIRTLYFICIIFVKNILIYWLILIVNHQGSYFPFFLYPVGQNIFCTPANFVTI